MINASDADFAQGFARKYFPWPMNVAKAIETDVPLESEAAAAEAKDSCPVGAIEEA